VLLEPDALEGQDEGSALAWLRMDVHRPVVLAHDAIRDREPAPRAVRLGREERVEDPREELRRDAGARVADDQLHPAGGLGGLGRLDGDLAAGWRREEENYRDMSHFSYAHSATLCSAAAPRIPDMDIALQVARHVTVLHYGRVIADGTREEIRENPLVREIYLGA
jgi:hypothetical protein